MATHPTLKARAGFSIAELVLVVAILAILITISTPSMYGFIRLRDVQTEQNKQQDIRRALEAYVADKNALPSMANWSSDLVGYTNMGANDIATDTWGRPRVYVGYTENNRFIQGTRVKINYATIVSAGPDRKAGNSAGIPGNAITGDYEPFVYSGSRQNWWHLYGAAPGALPGWVVDAFGQAQANGDDVMVKFTDYPEKLARYNTTIMRMEKVTQALETYARTEFGKYLQACVGNTTDPFCVQPEKVIYYPRSAQSGLPAELTGAGGVSYQPSGAVVVNNADTIANRRTQMTNLMRLLGMPDEFCCSALEIDASNLPMPFYYFSNPRARLAAGGCSTVRPGPLDNKLPPRITTVEDDTAATPTCG